MTERERKKEYLNQIIYIYTRIKDKQALIKELKINWQCPGSIATEMVRSGNGVKDTSNYSVALEALEEEVKRIEQELLEAQAERVRAINKLPHKYAAVLEKRYIHRKSFRQIGKEIGYEKSNVYDLHNQALDMLQIPSQ